MAVLVVFIILVILALMVVGAVVSVYNELQYYRKKVSRKWSDIQIILKQRLDNVMALSSIVERYSNHEHDSLRDTIKERGGEIEQNNEKPIEEGLVNIKALKEQYPELKADNLFTGLMSKDSDIENNVQEKRAAYNRVVQIYNTMISQFPRNIVAGYFKFYPIRYVSIYGLESYEPKKVMEYKPEKLKEENDGV